MKQLILAVTLALAAKAQAFDISCSYGASGLSGAPVPTLYGVVTGSVSERVYYYQLYAYVGSYSKYPFCNFNTGNNCLADPPNVVSGFTMPIIYGLVNVNYSDQYRGNFFARRGIWVNVGVPPFFAWIESKSCYNAGGWVNQNQ